MIAGAGNWDVVCAREFRHWCRLSGRSALWKVLIMDHALRIERSLPNRGCAFETVQSQNCDVLSAFLDDDLSGGR